MIEIGAKVLNVVEDFLEVLLNNSQDASQFDVAKSRYDVISDGMVLVPYQNWKLDIQALHHLSGLSFNLRVLRFTESDLPVTQ